MPAGTVYGTLLNFRAEVDALWAPQMNEPPYKAPPQAPVLYVKTANTWTPARPSDWPGLRCPRSRSAPRIGMVIGADSDVRASC
jgi:5-oxopent-3-ene-1,2,5-tricarboxylate decarboxylase/2-hydroxyhepta-2,4-diene-1,7-dioate isomerase